MIRTPKNFNQYPQAIAMILAVMAFGFVVVHVFASSVVGDLNNDGTVNVFDLSIMLSDWGAGAAVADLNHDGTVNVFDLSTLLSHWGQTGTTPTPTPTTTTTPVPAPSPTPTTIPVGSNTCTSPKYTLPLNPSNPQDGVTIGNFYVDTDTWNMAGYPGDQQTLYACDYDSWYAIDNIPNTSDGAVKTYPNVHEDFNEPRISTFHAISSSYAHTGPGASGNWEYAYDIWLNGVASSGSTELMVWTQAQGTQATSIRGYPSQGSVTLGGITYDIYKSGSFIVYVMRTPSTIGSVNLLEIFNHVISKGWIPSTSTLGAIDYGVEISGTNSTNMKFEVNNFSLAAN